MDSIESERACACAVVGWVVMALPLPSFHPALSCSIVVVALREGLETGGDCSSTLLLLSTVSLMLVDFMISFAKAWCLGRTEDHSVSSVPNLGTRLKSTAATGFDVACGSLSWSSRGSHGSMGLQVLRRSD
ncbi:hypothetical protein OPV22_023151 [Ensete ventricosum]|uniref:Uncharacterized protein n=1 Tax=Ensete ventricosum TaxID=4639 RepID=A0AAV8QW11_ENSVE|nr:hypothetical protein OPV22_023151 [Ensete ventricosum]